MRLVRITSVLAVAGVAVWAALPGGVAAAQTPEPAAATTATAAASQARAVTLITGDTVRVSSVNGQTAVDVQPAKGREKVPFVTSSAGGNVRVIPADAAGLLASGRLDARLFDVSTLLSFGYDDTRRTLPLLIQGTVQPSGARLTRQLDGVVAYEQDRGKPAELWQSLTSVGQLRSGVTKVWLDGLREPTLDVSVPLIGAPAAWQAGLTGTGVKVAVIDSGVDLQHPDLAGQVDAAEDFTGSGDLTDYVGHGTHVASTIVGTGAASDGKYKGVAPGAKLLSAKVCEVEGCPESSILAGMQWAAEQGATVANMSLGGDDTPDVDPIEAAVHDLTARYGMLFVIAAGNSGLAGDVTINSPGSAEDALTVGAVTKTKELADFSSRGPRTADATVKPDITAPGVAIVAARSSASDLAPIDGNEAYTQLDGTSMATPHVAGAAALLAQEHPQWRATQLKATLTAAAAPDDNLGPYEQGAGLVDVARAIDQKVTADPVSLGIERGTTSQNRTITYANSSATPVTLNLALRTNAPDGLFKLSAPTVTVPAGGNATVTVTAGPGAALPDEPYGGEVTASAGTVRVETPIALDIARHTLTVSTPGVTGDNPRWVTMLTDLDRQTISAIAHTGDSTQVRLRAGRYVAQSYLFTGSEEDPAITSLADPAVTLDADRTVTMDARAAKPVAITVPDRTAVPAYNEAGWTIRTQAPQIWGANDPYDVLMNVNFARLRTGPASGSKKATGFVSYVSGSWAQSVVNSPAVYRVYFYERDRMMAGKTKALRAGDFATVRSRVGSDVPGVPVNRLAVARAPGNSAVYRSTDGRQSPLSFNYDVPRSIVEYYNRDQQTEWLISSSQPGYTHYESDWTSWQPGRAYDEKWASGVEGPVFPEPEFDQQYATRYFGDTIGGPGPLHGDGSGHEGFRFLNGGNVDVRLYRNGTEVGRSAWAPDAFQVPAESGDYRLHARFQSDPAFTRSTLVDAEWTFKSAHVADGKLVHLPMTAVRFSPDLDINNTAPGGRPYALPISLDRQVGAAPAKTKSLSVEASFDDGKTWRHLVVIRTGEKAVALVWNPRGKGFVSLRASAADTAGNTVRQTVIRAYRYQ
ncbi:S8 family serine peptidase [Actinoplanes sp. TBRC 11911]|uniref:S8 family serine peptidase n=1 Tax=Actinoplanes sp. TBRC 11911 TaxID=2729386 RepID=UPI00145D6ED9|nr:S8 family serine peptidase [Actinoplanes sp. TBRC 11911]NMO55676.1 S8 family serine peptidase [Actinoplanes sp. TBRC 11911]